MTDPFSDVLRAVRLTGGVFLDARFTAPWCVASHIAAEDCRPYLSSPAQVIGYHFLIEGAMRVVIDGEAPVEMRAGEIVLLPRNDPHVLASEDGLDPVSGRDLIRPGPDGALAQIDHGGGGTLTRMVCGFLGSDDDFNPLIAALPRALTLDLREVASREWIEASLRFAAHELAAGRLASSSALARLSELLLVEAVRAYAQRLGESEVGWLKGLADPQIGRALALIHRDLAHPWTAEELAKAAAMSRSAFIERFTALVGLPPIRYLTSGRLNRARLRLRDPRPAIAALAHEVGYESEEAFSRAFKREYGLSPAHWRARHAIA